VVWEYATAVAARLLGVNPFDRTPAPPVVAVDRADPGPPAFVDGPVEVHGTELAGASTVEDALGRLLSRVGSGGYLGVLAFLDRERDADLAPVRARLADHTRCAVTLGWGPRYLHTTGRHHTNGPATGSFLMITGRSGADLGIPGRPFTFGQLEAAQAADDRQALTRLGRPLVHLRLTDRAAGVRRILAAVDALPWVS
jgi:glucose-6-phosphate isomerase